MKYRLCPFFQKPCLREECLSFDRYQVNRQMIYSKTKVGLEKPEQPKKGLFGSSSPVVAQKTFYYIVAEKVTMAEMCHAFTHDLHLQYRFILGLTEKVESVEPYWWEYEPYQGIEATEEDVEKWVNEGEKETYSRYLVGEPND